MQRKILLDTLKRDLPHCNRKSAGSYPTNK